MGKKGLLKMSDFGYTMPVTDPVCDSPPYFFRNVDLFAITFETDYESAAVMVPDLVEFAHDVPRASVMLSNIRMSSFGPYGEAILGFHVTFQGKPYTYLSNLFVTQEDPLSSCREIYGYAKKIAKIEFNHERNQFTCLVDRPVGNRILTATVSPQKQLRFEDWQNTDLLSLKHIPSVEEGKPPEVCQLVSCSFALTPFVGSDGKAELFSCKGSVTWGSQSQDDAWHRASVKNIVGAVLGRFNIHLPYGFIVHDYLK